MAPEDIDDPRGNRELGLPVVRSSVPETTALGAAYLAGLAVGIIVAIATVWTGAQPATLIFLTAGWAEGVTLLREWSPVA